MTVIAPDRPPIILDAPCQVLVKKLLFRESLDEAVHELHAKITAGELQLEDGRFPPAALQVCLSSRPSNVHLMDAARTTWEEHPMAVWCSSGSKADCHPMAV